jgi:hypothetical protein
MSENASWNGTPMILQVNSSIGLAAQDGTVILAATNESTANNQGEIGVTSGGGAPALIPVAALAPLPSVGVFAGGGLQVTNLSANVSTPIRVQAIGPGISGVTPKDLRAGSTVVLGPGEVAEGSVSEGGMVLKIQANTAGAAAAGVIGGPLDPNGMNGEAIALNAPSNTPPQGYHAATTANTFSLSFNWSTGSIFVGNLSSQPLTFTLSAAS